MGQFPPREFLAPRRVADRGGGCGVANRWDSQHRLRRRLPARRRRGEPVNPAGWTATLASRIFSLAPGGYADFRARIAPPEGVAPGLWFVAVRACSGDDDVEDVVTVAVPGEDQIDQLPRQRQAHSVPDPIKVQGTSSERPGPRLRHLPGGGAHPPPTRRAGVTCRQRGRSRGVCRPRLKSSAGWTGWLCPRRWSGGA